jgi:molecular chaperone DnaK
MTTVGIDFGTTNSVLAKWTPTGIDVLDIDQAPGEWSGHGFSKVMPSVFATGTDGQALFGWAAKRAERGGFEAVKRLFATQQGTVIDDAGTALAVEEVATLLFAELKRGATENGVPASSAVITVPANSRGLARHRTKICAGMAGLEVKALLNEPTAAAMAYAVDYPGDQQILVFDWGGGTLDVTILRSVGGVFMEQASMGLPTKGGMDFDSRLARAVRETLAEDHQWDETDRHKFALQIELAKIELSREDKTELRLPGGDVRRVTRTMFEQAVQPLVEESRRPLERCLHDIGAGPGVIDAVVMVGGTSQVPLVRRFVTELLGQEPVSTINPMTAVGEGAAIAAAILSGELDTNDFFVSTEHALGTITHEPHSTTPRFSVLIPRNHKLPASSTERFSPVFDDQDVVDVHVIEGDPDEQVDHPDNVVLTNFPVKLPEHEGSNADRSFDITYRYDSDGILHVEVDDPISGQLLERHEVSFGITDDRRALVEMSKRTQATMDTGKLSDDAAEPSHTDPEIASLLQRAYVKVVPFLDEDDAAAVRAVADRLHDAGPDELPSAKEELQAALAPYPYLF